MKRIFSALLLLVMMLSVCTIQADAAGNATSTTPTGYTKASDVEYIIYTGYVLVNSSNVYVSNVVVNWGARGEDCVFLSTYAESFYTDSNTFDVFSEMDGGTGVSNAYTSELYTALQTFMKSRHSNITSYDGTRAYYCFTDCVSNDYSMVCSFYSGTMVSSVWNGGNNYNREHVWPRSKCINQSKAQDSADIMMLRATISTENGSRGNKAYGESSGYSTPSADVRGDCARMVLYGYVRWGNTSYMWGSGGVIENLDILLKWMEEDPVDTWEMGRNDSIQSITGTRNVFVDYPELAWVLFGEEIPNGLVTPSGSSSGTSEKCNHTQTALKNQKVATCTESGYTGDTYCSACGERVSAGKTVSATGHTSTEVRNKVSATCTESGYTGDTYCKSCNTKTKAGSTVAATGHSDSNGDGCCDSCQTVLDPPSTETTAPPTTEAPTAPPVTEEPTVPPTTEAPTVPPATEEPTTPPTTEHQHIYDNWIIRDGGCSRTCVVCGHIDTLASEPSPGTEPAPSSNPAALLWAIIAVVVVAGIIVTVILLIKRKKKQ